VLGVILLFEAVALMRLMADMAGSRKDFTVVILVGLMALGLPYGYVIGLVTGTLLAKGLNLRVNSGASRQAAGR
jgi:hypothetical protein